MLPKLNFPQYTFRIKRGKDKLLIFDRVRKKFVVLSPEEWVRQHVLVYLIEEKQFPESLLAVEKELKVVNRMLRPDIVLFSTEVQPVFLVECKAPTVEINENVLVQAANYNYALGLRHIFLTNGEKHFFLELGANGEYCMRDAVPSYEELLKL